MLPPVNCINLPAPPVARTRANMAVLPQAGEAPQRAGHQWILRDPGGHHQGEASKGPASCLPHVFFWSCSCLPLLLLFSRHLHLVSFFSSSCFSVVFLVFVHVFLLSPSCISLVFFVISYLLYYLPLVPIFSFSCIILVLILWSSCIFFSSSYFQCVILLHFHYLPPVFLLSS